VTRLLLAFLGVVLAAAAPSSTPTRAARLGAGQGYRADPARPYAHPFFWAPFILMGNWL
jgi:CHAT domain-containing protein